MDAVQLAAENLDRLKWVEVQSSNLRRVAYLPSLRVLVVEFRSGAVYAYERVGRKAFVGLMTAASHGEYFHAAIRTRKSYRRLR